MFHLKDIFKPRQMFRIKSYYNNKKWFDLFRYVIIGYHTPFDLYISPIFHKDVSKLRGYDYDLRDVLLDGKEYRRKKKIEQL